MLQKIFGNERIIGYAGNPNTGKTNNLCAAMIEYMSKTGRNVVVYGFPDAILEELSRHGTVIPVASLEQMTTYENVLIVIDEMQRLNLNDRRYRELLNAFTDFIHHNNNYCIITSPSLREFNSVIGGKISRWVVKSLSQSSLVNGSQLKGAVRNYKGRYKVIDDVRISNDSAVVLGDNHEIVIKFPYVEAVDTKKNNEDIFAPLKKKEVKKKKQHKSLRVEKSKNNQTKGTKNGEQYELDNFKF